MNHKELAEGYRREHRIALTMGADCLSNADDRTAIAAIKDDSIKLRILMERAIVRQAVSDLIAAGHAITVDYGDGQYGIKKSQDLGAVMAEIGACDEEWLRVWKLRTDQPALRLGSICLVYGNDGYDVLADYATTLEELLENANQLADAFAELE